MKKLAFFNDLTYGIKKSFVKYSYVSKRMVILWYSLMNFFENQSSFYILFIRWIRLVPFIIFLYLFCKIYVKAKSKKHFLPCDKFHFSKMIILTIKTKKLISGNSCSISKNMSELSAPTGFFCQNLTEF